MTTKPARPGAHGEGIPDASHVYVTNPEGWRPVFMADGELTEEFRASLREYVDAELAQIEPPRTLTVRITYTGPAHPRAAIESALRALPAKHFQWEVVEGAD